MLKNYNALIKGSYMELSFFFKNPKGRAPLVIFQMGKVGSTSIVRSLEKEKLSMPVFQVHYLNPKVVEKFIKKPFEGTIALHTLTSRYLLKLMEKGIEGGEPWKIISPVREPVARNISAFFENIKGRVPGLDARIERGEVTDDELIKYFMDSPQHLPLSWFNIEMKPVFGIDVFSKDFDTKKGYQTYSGESAELLVIRLESFDDAISQAFAEFLGLKDFKLKRVNIAEDKKYNDVYRRIVDNIVLPEEYLDMMYNSNYAKLFYSPQEIEGFRKRWGKR